MKKLIIFVLLLLFILVGFKVEGNSQGLNEKEIIERLTRLEEGIKRLEENQKAIIREMDKRFEAVDKRFEAVDKRFEGIDKRFEGIDKRFEGIDKRLDQIINLFMAIIGAFSAIVAVTIGFAIWDRRTMIKPFETKVKSIEEEIANNKKMLHLLIEALKTLSQTDEKLAEILKKFNIL